MPTYSLATVTLPSVDLNPKHDVVNTFVIGHPVGWDPSTELGEVTIPLASFWTQIAPGNTYTLGSRMSASRSRAALACRIRLYDIEDHLDGSNYGSPYEEDQFTLPTPSTLLDGLPEEVAVVMTTRAFGYAEQPVEVPIVPPPANPPLSERPRSRYTGRNFIGPLLSGVSTFDAVLNAPRVVNTFRDAILNAGERLNDQLVVGGHAWQIWSRADSFVRPVSHLQVDEEFDTMRSRGNRTMARTTRQINP